MDPTHPVHLRPTLGGAARLLASAELPSEDLTDGHLEHFFWVGNASTPHGLIGLELHEEDALLRSLVVAPDRRGTGVSAIYLLTTTAEQFFRRRGYVEADRALAPSAIRATREFADLCPASSAFLVKSLTAGAR
jgi:amino-acid N-acetyltransferase